MNWLAASVKSQLPQYPSNSKAIESVKLCTVHTAWQLCFDLRGKIWSGEFVRRSKQKDKNLLSVRSRQKAENESWQLFVLAALPISCCQDWSGECQQLSFHVFVENVFMYLLKMLKNEVELVCFLQILLQPAALRGLGSWHGHGEKQLFWKVTKIFDSITLSIFLVILFDFDKFWGYWESETSLFMVMHTYSCGSISAEKTRYHWSVSVALGSLSAEHLWVLVSELDICGCLFLS